MSNFADWRFIPSWVDDGRDHVPEFDHIAEDKEALDDLTARLRRGPVYAHRIDRLPSAEANRLDVLNVVCDRVEAKNEARVRRLRERGVDHHAAAYEVRRDTHSHFTEEVAA